MLLSDGGEEAEGGGARARAEAPLSFVEVSGKVVNCGDPTMEKRKANIEAATRTETQMRMKN